MTLLIAPNGTITGRIALSGSKSLSNRLVLLKAILKSNLELHNLSDSQDTLLLNKALQQIKEGCDNTINIHHAGTDMRFLTAYLSITAGEWVITGSDRMKKRPIGELVSALKILGANISYLENDGYPPLKIIGTSLKGGELDINGSISSQFISALLLIAPDLENGLTLHLKGEIVSLPYITMTVEILKFFGITVQMQNSVLSVKPNRTDIETNDYEIESDWSAASYWYSICALSPNSKIELSHFLKTSLQADSILPSLFKKLGVNTEYSNKSIFISQTESKVNHFDYDFTYCPDIAQTIAVTCFGLGISANLTGLQTLKVKETDRIIALKTELEKCGAITEITTNSISIKARKQEKGSLKNEVTIETYNDHRMAMCFAPLSLIFNALRFANPDVVSKSYPRFWEDLKSVGFSVNLQP